MPGQPDEVTWRLLEALQRDARVPLKALAAAAGLSVAATAERLRRLREDGLLERIGIDLEPSQLGYAVKAVIGITVLKPHKQALIEKLESAAEVIECLHVAGEESYLLTVVAVDLPALEAFISSINGFGETRTSIVFSTPIRRRGLISPGRVRKPAK